ncbi:MAG TPA: arginine--tRNA ligase [Myxococcota bacterium]|nr:arginine--tRNA ligase [Myxococcota bacterium]
MRQELQSELEGILRRLLDAAGDPGPLPEFTLEIPRQKDHGDFACNAALVLGKRLRRPPREIAGRIADALRERKSLVARTEVAGPGFLNVWLAGSRWQDLLRRVLAEGAAYGRNAAGAGRKVQVEFVSANPTGPLTLGHGRQAVIGDAIARLLISQGYDVTREYYFNNAGRQMRMLGESLRARYLERLGLAAPPTDEALADPEHHWQDSRDGLPVAFPKGGYQGDYIGEIADDVLRERGKALVDEPGDGQFREIAEARVFAEIRRTLDACGIHFDVYTNEQDLYDRGLVADVLAALRKLDLAYDKDDATWFRATARGLERDRVLVKRTGEATYLLPDIAYHMEKFRRGFDHVIDVQGADHVDQFPFVVEAAAALGCPKGRIELVMHQFVTLTKDDEQVKQSKRRANYVTVDALLASVGADVFRFFMVQRRSESHLEFDLDLAKSTDWTKNPAYYLQYAHARSCGIERKAAEQGVALPDAQSVLADALVLPEELEILKKIAEFPEMLERAASTREPHHVAYYARELAGLWNPYLQDGVRHRVVSEDAALTNGRLGLAVAVKTVLGNALGVLGIGAPERM